jgi:hypothetical protein
MNSSKKWNELPDMATIDRTIAALKENGIEAVCVNTAGEARARVLELIPAGAEVMTMSSRTLEEIGLTRDVDESGKFQSVRKKLNSMNRAVQNREMQRLGAAPEWAVSSVHAVTEDGHLMIASLTGSQHPAEANGSDHVIYVAGTHKIVKDIMTGMARIQEFVLPLESERAKKAYGISGSAINKLLIINGEKLPYPSPLRSHIILVNQVLGF